MLGHRTQFTVIQSSVLERLGHIDLLLTDKTGTLTRKEQRLFGLYFNETAITMEFSSNIIA